MVALFLYHVSSRIIHRKFGKKTSRTFGGLRRYRLRHNKPIITNKSLPISAVSRGKNDLTMQACCTGWSANSKEITCTTSMLLNYRITLTTNS